MRFSRVQWKIFAMFAGGIETRAESLTERCECVVLGKAWIVYACRRQRW
jgi:hypothetical protein